MKYEKCAKIVELWSKLYVSTTFLRCSCCRCCSSCSNILLSLRADEVRKCVEIIEIGKRWSKPYVSPTLLGCSSCRCRCSSSSCSSSSCSSFGERCFKTHILTTFLRFRSNCCRFSSSYCCSCSSSMSSLQVDEVRGMCRDWRALVQTTRLNDVSSWHSHVPRRSRLKAMYRRSR